MRTSASRFLNTRSMVFTPYFIPKLTLLSKFYSRPTFRLYGSYTVGLLMHWMTECSCRSHGTPVVENRPPSFSNLKTESTFWKLLTPEKWACFKNSLSLTSSTCVDHLTKSVQQLFARLLAPTNLTLREEMTNQFTSMWSWWKTSISAWMVSLPIFQNTIWKGLCLEGTLSPKTRLSPSWIPTSLRTIIRSPFAWTTPSID